MAAYTPDVVVTLDTDRGRLTVNLARGGEQFPWADHQGRVIIGPADGTMTSDGTSMESLAWNVSPFWVVEAYDLSGDVVQLSPAQYGEALTQAVEKTGQSGLYPDASTYEA